MSILLFAAALGSTTSRRRAATSGADSGCRF